MYGETFAASSLAIHSAISVHILPIISLVKMRYKWNKWMSSINPRLASVKLNWLIQTGNSQRANEPVARGNTIRGQRKIA